MLAIRRRVFQTVSDLSGSNHRVFIKFFIKILSSDVSVNLIKFKFSCVYLKNRKKQNYTTKHKLLNMINKEVTSMKL